MPRVPGSDYVSQQQVPGSGNFEQASGAALAAPYQVLEQGAKQIEATGMLAQRHLQYIEAEKQRMDDSNTALRNTNAAIIQYGQLEDRLKNGYTDPATGQKVDAVSAKNYVQSVQDGGKEIQDNLLSQIEDPALKTFIGNHLLQLHDSRLIQAQHYSTSLAIQENQQADIINVQESAANAANADNAIDRNRVINDTKAQIDFKYGSSQPKYAQILKDKFDVSANTAYMQKVLHDDPVMFGVMNDRGDFNKVPYDTRTHLLNQWREARARKVADAKAIYDVNKVIFENDFYAGLNLGTVTPDTMARIAAGRHDYITSKEYPHILQLYNNPPDGRGNQEAGALRDEYLKNLTSIPTIAYINEYSKRAARLSDQLGVQNKGITAFLEELKHDRVTASAGNTKAVNLELNKFEAGLKQIKQGTIGLSFYDHQIRSQLENADGFGRGMIYGGNGTIKSEEALKEVQKQYENVTKKKQETPAGRMDRIRIPD